MASDLRKVGALWRNTSKNGKTFYSGKLDPVAMKSALVGDEVRLLIFPVKEKRGKGPDIELFCVPDRDTRTSHVRDEDHGHSEPSRRLDDPDDFGDLP